MTVAKIIIIIGFNTANCVKYDLIQFAPKCVYSVFKQSEGNCKRVCKMEAVNRKLLSHTLTSIIIIRDVRRFHRASAIATLNIRIFLSVKFLK